MPFELAMQTVGQKRVLVFEQAYTRNAEAFFFGGADTVAASSGSSCLCFFCVDVTAVESADCPDTNVQPEAENQRVQCPSK